MRTGSTRQAGLASSRSPLFGREAELAMLDQLVAQIPSEAGRWCCAVILAGPPFRGLSERLYRGVECGLFRLGLIRGQGAPQPQEHGASQVVVAVPDRAIEVL
jgi:hypothetical protein